MGAPYDAIEAIKYAWQKFTENVAPFAILAGIGLVLYYIYAVVTNLLLPGGPFDSGVPSGGEMAVAGLVRLLFGLVMTVAGWVLSVAMVRGALDVVDTGHTDLGRMFTRIPWLQVLLAGILVTLVVMVGTVLCIIPGIIAAFLLVFTQVGVLEGQEAIDAMRSSFELAKTRVGDVLIYLLLTGVVGAIVVLCTCGLASVVVGPVYTIGLVFTWRILQGRTVAA